jgi:hypothetical protein
MNGTIFIQFEGQLCNQMLQVSAGYSLSKKWNMDLVFFYNPNKQWEYRNVEYFKNFTLYFLKFELFYRILNLAVRFQAILLFASNRINRYLKNFSLIINLNRSKINLINNLISFNEG